MLRILTFCNRWRSRISSTRACISSISRFCWISIVRMISLSSMSPSSRSSVSPAGGSKGSDTADADASPPLTELPLAAGAGRKPLLLSEALLPLAPLPGGGCAFACACGGCGGGATAAAAGCCVAAAIAGGGAEAAWA